MNTQLRELRDAERKEIQEVYALKEDAGDAFHEIIRIEEKYRILRAEFTVVNDWEFPAEEWATLSQEAKIIIVEMMRDATRYNSLREDLEGWLEEAPRY
jgi:hypothetical protein